MSTQEIFHNFYKNLEKIIIKLYIILYILIITFDCIENKNILFL
jgi:hypothetical protein